MIPLMFLATVTATAPLVYWSLREHRELHRPGRLIPAQPAGQARPPSWASRGTTSSPTRRT